MMRQRFLPTLFFVLLFLGAGAVFGQSKKQLELEKRREALRQEMQQLLRLRETNIKKERSELNQVADLDQQIKVRQDLIKVTNRQANLLSREIDENLNKMENLREELTLLKEDYADMIRKSYKAKGGESKVMFLLSSENFKQAYKRLQYMKQYANYRKKQAEQIKERTALLQETNTELLRQKKDKDALIAENRKARMQLDKEKEQHDALLALIRKKSAVFAVQIKKNQAESRRIEKQIDRLIAEAIAASNKKTGNKATTKGSKNTFALTPEAKLLSADFASNKGRLIWPVVRGRVIKRFGKSKHPTLPNITINSSGVEIETAAGTAARAVFDGEVLAVQKIPGAHSVVTVRHGSYITVYNNLQNLQVSKGDKVKRGQEIGAVAISNISGKTVLKFGVRKNTTKLNPSQWVLNM
ncbi:MAG: peptidoglycan DD-metalloendopeptidase family protein [Dokdonia sp.]|jgi:septal ring factor EnvC (AmiA/AmiB activator)